MIVKLICKKIISVICFITLVFCLVNRASAQGNQVVTNGGTTTAVTFTGTGCYFNWTNDKSGIGLAASGNTTVPAFTAINAGTTPITATITGTPRSIGYAYIPNQADGTVSVVNNITNAVVKTITVGTNPLGVAVNPMGTLAYVTNNGSATITGNISVINTSTNTVINTINEGAYPEGAALSPDGNTLYVANLNLNVVKAINVTTGAVLYSVGVGTNPYAVTISPDGSRVYAVNYASNNVSVINTVTHLLVTNINVGMYPVAAALSPDGTKLYVANQISNTITVINAITNSIITSIPVGQAPVAVVLSTDGTKLYVSNANDNNVSVINTAGYGLITNIPVGTLPYGISVNPDGSQLFVSNVNSNNVSIINTATNIVTGTAAVGNNPYATGTYFTIGSGCSSTTATFTITVNPTPVPTIVASAATGTISACMGTASASPNIQQFTVSGNNLTTNIVATAPAGFQLSLSSAGGFTNSISLSPTGGVVSNTIVYARSASTAATGSINGNVVLTSTGATAVNVAVSGTVNPLPIANAVANQTVMNNTATAAINFTGTANTYNWVNDTPAIGLAANGSGNIASFTAINPGLTPVTATITVTPNASTGCTGTPITFKIIVNPDAPAIITSAATGTISACAGTASISPSVQQFTVSGNHLLAAITASTPVGFEVSLLSTGAFSNTISLNPTGGAVVNTVIYVRSATSAPSGNITGVVNLASVGATSQNVPVSGVINPVPTVNAVLNQSVSNGSSTTAVTFAGAANTYNWVNDTPGIGLAAIGTGNISSFAAVNTSISTVTATITITPVNTTGCTGSSIAFTIKVIPSPIITATGTLSPLTSVYGTASQTTNFSVSGTNMTAGILITPPSGFEVSISPTSGFGSKITVGSAGNISSVTVYIRLLASVAVGSYSGNVILSSAGATAVLVPTATSTVTPAPLTITPANESRTYGKVLAGGSGSKYFTSVGLQNSEAIGSLTIAYGAGSLVTDGAGTYTGSVQASSATGGTFNPSNYTIVYNTGDMIVYPAALTITADDKNKGLGTDNPVLTTTYIGFVNGDTPASLTTLPTISTAASKQSPAGLYPIIVSGAASPNYAITYIKGTLTIDPAPLVPNAFTPNGDGVNDTWNIKYLDTYPGNTVDVFNRYGQKVYNSTGYATPWDGTYKGSYLPTGTYYYIINRKNGLGLLSGFVAIIR